MGKRFFLVIGILILFVLTIFGKLSVVATIPPLGYAALSIGGTAIDLSVLLKPGDNPHNFSLTPNQAVSISKADVLIDLGLEEDKWISEKVKAINSSVKIIDTTEGLSQFLIGDSGSYNPHVWLDVKLYEMMAVNVYTALVRIDPGSTSYFTQNFGKFMLNLNLLDGEIRDSLLSVKGKPFVAQHPAWVYFARAYGLGKEYSLESDSGQSIGPQDYRNIINIMRKNDIKSIIGDPVTPSKITNELSSQTGASIVMVNPISVFDYFDLMKSVTNGFLEALNGKGR